MASIFILTTVLVLDCADARKEGQGKTTTSTNSSGEGDRNIEVGSRLALAEMQKLLTLHNQVRREVRVPPLIWSKDLAGYAQEWADHLAATGCGLEHRPQSGKWQQQHGENLWRAAGEHPIISQAVEDWASEKKYYHGGALNASNWSASGHYTQIVWKDTQQVGCAKAMCNGTVIVVCNYAPPGNVLGQKPYN